ncbi:phosphate starvation-inducible protein PsiF [Rhodanobacter glycinis]|uniref:Phosphate starvation-inducible protein PsiF n=1 Tax=Rhodanobacter glycinis TaxID=582702 RepID=A0A502FP88_9GAMM|nr:PsiF family protein [Rhodanobacter glycinis]TPG10529.1 phosphate starvation-inducible protein PsiF [Rhodanobacter glycinis]TPG51265.1 phosphate starvation-inducible protein PsiF [Rhodanobacter glycinis]
MSMSLRLLAVSAAFAFAGATFAATPPAAATAPTKPHTAQQQRMVDCNKQATGKKGAERKTFMSTCLKAGSTTAAATPAAAAAPSAKQAQQDKMKTCNATAKTKALKGAERKSFMSTCLKGDTAAPAAH